MDYSNLPVLLVVDAAVALLTFYLAVNALEETLGGDDSLAVMRQAVRLAYIDYVLERYDEGLSAEQITATIDLAVEPTSGEPEPGPGRRRGQLRRGPPRSPQS